MDKHAILRLVGAAGVQLVRFLYCGNDGIIRGKTAHADFLESYLETGIGLTVAMQSFNMLDQLVPEGGFGPVGEIRLLPDLTTFAILPYAPKSARVFCDLVQLDRRPWPACPRTFLKGVVERLRARGLAPFVAFENEFTLARREGGGYVPLDESRCFSSIGMDSAAGPIIEIVEALRAQGVQVEQYYPELGPGQQEMPVRFAEALRAADNQLVVRETARGVAAGHGLIASFAPKPFPERAGNGSHLHLSLWGPDGQNLFHDPHDSLGLSGTAYHFIGGVLAHLPALVALTTPSVNSFRRLQPRSWSSAFTCYGPDNREAAIRVPSKRWGLEMPSTNLELKAVDPSCNPYLALGSVLAAGLDGIERGLDPGEALLVDPATLSEAERERRGIRRLPTNLREALDALQKDEVLLGALGDVLAHEYLAVKGSEWNGFAGKDVSYEIEKHFYAY